MRISLSLSKPPARKRGRKASSKVSPASGKMPRMGSHEFVKANKTTQKKYLEAYPMSSHRFLLSGQTKPKGAAPAPDVEKKKPKKPKTLKRISRAEYDRLDKKAQKAYDKEYNSSKRRKFIGKKHFATHKRNAINRRKEELAARPKLVNRLARLSAAQEEATNRHRTAAQRDLKAGITPEAVKAVTSLTHNDTKQGAETLRANKSKTLKSFEDKLEEDRLDSLEITDDDRERIQQKIDEGKDPNADELEDAIKAKKPTKKQKKVVEDELDQKPQNFFQRDLAAMRKIISGERVEPKGKHNFIIAGGILGKYMMMASGVALLAMGAAPLALHIAKTLWDTWGESTANSDGDEDYGIDRLYDAITDHLQNMDIDDLHSSVAKTKFVSESSAAAAKTLREKANAPRISYRAVPEEKEFALHDRTRLRVMLDKNEVGRIYADYDGDIQKNLRIWRAYVTSGFNALEFPHLDEPGDTREPYIITNDDADVEHNLELHCPTLMTLAEARNWVCSIIERDTGDKA